MKIEKVYICGLTNEPCDRELLCGDALQANESRSICWEGVTALKRRFLGRTISVEKNGKDGLIARDVNGNPIGYVVKGNYSDKP